MAKKKKRTHKVASPHKKKTGVQLERCCLVAKKMLSHFGLDPKLLDVFTKKQREYLLSLFPVDFPSIKAKKEDVVPRQYVNKIREDVLQFMKTTYLGDPKNRLSIIDFTLYGIGFYYSILELTKLNWFNGTSGDAASKLIYSRFDQADIFGSEDGYASLKAYLLYLTRGYSQANFRLYGFTCELELPSPKSADKNSLASIRLKIQITARDCETKVFTYNGIKRKAFRMIFMPVGSDNNYSCGAIIQQNKFFPNAKEEQTLDIYIQSHALYRFKERIDVFDATFRNYLIQQDLIFIQNVVPFGKHFLLSCTIDGTAPIGYFTYFVSGGDLVVNTFLPLISKDTPEGAKFCQLLPLSKEDFIYLGMDKISFYFTVDFEQIPILKNALTGSGIWNTITAIEAIFDNDDELSEKELPAIDMNKTKFVKNFFDKIEQ